VLVNLTDQHDPEESQSKHVSFFGSCIYMKHPVSGLTSLYFLTGVCRCGACRPELRNPDDLIALQPCAVWGYAHQWNIQCI
jgi:hypothetical protein